MRNITGSPAENEDFFDRPRDTARLKREFNNSTNILLVAPRRVGKTSLVLRVCEIMREIGWGAVFLNVEGCSDELSFAEKLVGGLREQKLQPEMLSRMGMMFAGIRKTLDGVKLGAAGVDVELKADDPDHSTLGKALESIFREIEKGDQNVVIAIDEMPELLLALAGQDQGTERVARLLHWLRALRQTHRRRIRWVFLGSIGLDSFVDNRSLRHTINDLTTLGLEALTPEEADRFLERLGTDNQLPLPTEVREAIIQRVGWPLPHHLQILFHAMVDAEVGTADLAAVDRAFNDLLKPEQSSQFDTWRQRLAKQFTATEAATAKTILRHLCQHPEGRSRSQLLNKLMEGRPQADSQTIEELLAELLPVLQRDGYLLGQNGQYAFRSFLLREYWFRREVQ